MTDIDKWQRVANALVELLVYSKDGISPFYIWDEENVSYRCFFCREWHFTNHKADCPLLEANRALADLNMGWTGREDV